MGRFRYKKIRILDDRRIPALGGIQGPILNWYRESTDIIKILIRDGFNVEELTPLPTTPPTIVKLTLQNYSEDNGAGAYDKEYYNPEPGSKKFGKMYQFTYSSINQDTRKKYLYDSNKLYKKGDKVIYQLSSTAENPDMRNIWQIFICVENTRATGIFDHGYWRYPESAEEAKLEYVKPPYPQSFIESGIPEFDPNHQYARRDKVGYYESEDGTWYIYKCTHRNGHIGPWDENKWSRER